MSALQQRIQDELDLGGDASTLVTVVQEWARELVPDLALTILSHEQRKELIGAEA